MVWIWISSWKSKIKPSSYKRPRNFYWQENPTIISSFVYCSTLEIYLCILHIKTRFAFISLFFSALSLINSLIAFPFPRSFLLLVRLLSAHSDIFLYIPRVFTDQFSGCLHFPGEVTLVGGILLLIRTIDYTSIFFLSWFISKSLGVVLSIFKYAISSHINAWPIAIKDYPQL